MATIITVTDKKFQIPNTPYMIQTDDGVDEYEFQVTENNTDLSNFDFFLQYRNSQNVSNKVALTKLGTTQGGAIRLKWVLDDDFTAVKGNSDIQLMARNGSNPTVIWHTLPAKVFLYDDVMHCI